MGILGILFITFSIFYGSVEGISELAIYLVACFVIAYIIPLSFHWRRIKYLDTLKGLIYIAYMTPTYINILAIYAIANIHDISWTSNPYLSIEYKSEIEKEKIAAYKNFRSVFLIFWVVLNISIGIGMVLLKENEVVDFIFIIGYAVIVILVYKLFFTYLFVIKSWYQSIKVRNKIATKESVIFTESDKERTDSKIQEFDGIDQIRPSQRDRFRSTVLDRHTYRGFSQVEINKTRIYSFDQDSEEKYEDRSYLSYIEEESKQDRYGLI
jgi:hypothetical protein